MNIVQVLFFLYIVEKYTQSDYVLHLSWNSSRTILNKWSCIVMKRFHKGNDRVSTNQLTIVLINGQNF
jgi:hypothetical protein